VPDRRFIATGPAPTRGDTLKLNGAENVGELLQSIAPDTGDLTDPVVTGPLLADRNLSWRPPTSDPLSGEPVIRLVRPAFSHGKPILVFVRNLSVRQLTAELSGTDFGEVALVVDPAGKVILSTEQATGDHGLTSRILGMRSWTRHTSGIEHRYLSGLFMGTAPLTSVGWTMIYAFSRRTILVELRPRLVGCAVAMLLLLLDHKVFTPACERSRRIFDSENLNRAIVAAAPSGFRLRA
jgi:two-component system capsular synthesis sensor histidine kinase RcsC